MKTSLKSLIAAAALMGSFGVAPAWAVDWAGVPGKDVVLFYPGQSPFEWQLTPTDHSGAPKFRDGKNCHECHDGEEKSMGTLLVSGKKNACTSSAWPRRASSGRCGGGRSAP